MQKALLQRENLQPEKWDATEKLFLYTLYSRLKQIKTLYIVLLYAK